MAYTVNVSNNAASELEGTVAYIAERFAAPHAIASLLADYDRAIDALSINPEAYSVDEGMSKLISPVLQDAPRRFVVDYLDAAFE